MIKLGRAPRNQSYKVAFGHTRLNHFFSNGGATKTNEIVFLVFLTRLRWLPSFNGEVVTKHGAATHA